MPQGESAFYFGVAVNSGDALAKLRREGDPDPNSLEENPAPTVKEVGFPFDALPVSYAVGSRFGLGHGLELQFSGEAWHIAGLGLSGGLKWQFAGLSKDDRFAAAFKVRLGGAFAGAGTKEDGGGITLGVAEMGLPLSIHPTGDNNAIYIQPRLGVLNVQDRQNGAAFNDSATVFGGGLTTGGLIRIGSALLVLEGSVLYVPQQNNLDDDAIQFFGAIGVVFSKKGSHPLDGYSPP